MKARTGYLFKRGGVYHVRWVVNGKAYSRSTGTSSLKKAHAKQAEIMAPFAVGHEVDVLSNVAARIERRTGEMTRMEDDRNPPLKVADAWAAYLDTPNRPDSGDATLDQYELQWERFAGWMAKNHGDAPAMRDVTQAHAEEYAGHLTKTVGPSTFNRHVGLLSLVFRMLFKPARLTSNPWLDIQRKRAMSHSRRELTVDELRRLCAAADGELRLLLALGIYTGLRLGDCATLRWAEVDVVRGQITRIPLKVARRHPQAVLIPIHPTLGGMLAEIPESRRTGHVMPGMAEAYDNRRDAVTDAIQRLLWNCGIPCHAPGTGMKVKTKEDGTPVITNAGNVLLVSTGKPAVVQVGFHSLRHSFVSLCRAANAPLSVVQSIVGHSAPALTNHYTHTGTDAARLAVDALPSLMEGVTPVSHALPLPRAADGAAGERKPVPEWIRTALSGILAALDAGKTETARRELAALTA